MNYEFGKPTQAEYAMTEFSSDPSASGAVLYNRGTYKVEVREDYVKLVLRIHKRIKVFDAKRFDHASVAINYYTGGSSVESIHGLQVITHQDGIKKMLSKDEVYNTQDNSYWSTLRFTFPDVQDGSILEYTYELVSPYFSHLKEWNFAGALPTIYSELHMEMPGNFIYNKTLYGNRKLDYETAYLKKSCFHLPGYRVPGDCEVGTYIMKNVPTIKKEEFMLSTENYSPALRFELVQLTDMRAETQYITSSWKNLDSYFKGHSNIGRQLRQSKLMKKVLPDSIFKIEDDTERAKAIYYSVQEYMHWNGLRRYLTQTDVKKAIKEKSGHSSEINLALINAMEAADLDVHAMLIADRASAMPSQLYPVLIGFDNIIAYLKIDGKKYFLDATDKNTSFGTLPLNSVNGLGRVLDFKKGSFWEEVVPTSPNVHFANIKISVQEDGTFSGDAEEMYTGYMAMAARTGQQSLNLSEKLKQKQHENEHLEISDLHVENSSDLEQPYKEKYKFHYFQQEDAKRVYLKPLTIDPLFSKNPFLSATRTYPIDFGFPMVGNYLVSIALNDKYKFLKVPENKILKLPNGDGDFSVVYNVSDDILNMRFSIRLNTFHYPKEAYPALKQYFSEMIEAQSEVIELERI